MHLTVINKAAITQEAGHLCGYRLLARHLGFTLVELVTIIVIIGILAVAAAPRFFDRNVFDSRGFYDQVISSLRYAQKAAIAQRRFVCVDFTATSVALRYGTANTCAAGNLIGPTGGAYSVPAPNGVTLSGATNFYFDPLGRATPGQTINVSGYTAAAITVVAETGYVY